MLEKDWIYDAFLSEIKVSSANTHFKSYKDQLLLAKSSKEKKNFDVLINSVADIKKVVIPDFIEIIDSSSFNCDTKINTVQFSSKLKLTMSGKFGTLLYLPPEILTASDEDIHYDKSVDVYAFGMIAYEIVTGKVPFYEFGSS